MTNASCKAQDDNALRRPRLSRTARLAGLLSVTALGLTACGGSGDGDAAAASNEAPDDGVLRLGVLDDIGQPPDPDIYYSGNGLALTTNLYEGLVRYEPGNHDEANVVPLLATEWEHNDDFTEFTFELRDDVVFHDGTEFDASAVEASFDRRLAVDAGPAYMVAGVESVETVDDYTVTITLEESNSAFLDYLASPYGPRMISPAVIEENAEDNAEGFIAENSAGTGPYELTSASVGEGYTMEYFEDYWDEEIDPEFTTVELPVYTEISAMQLELENGDLHALLQGVPSTSREDYMEDDALSAYSLSSYQLGVAYMNPNRDILAEPEDRVTFFEGIDWAELNEQVTAYSAEAAEGNYPQGALPEYEDRPLVYEPDALAEWAAEREGEEIQIGHGSASADSEQMSNLIAAQLQELGLQATVTSHQSSEIFGDFYEDPASAPDVLVTSGTWPDSNNPYMHGHIFWDEAGGLNHLQCFDDEISELLDEALVTNDAETFNEAGELAYQHGCAPTFAWMSDFMVFQSWIAGVEEAHSIAAPATVDFFRLSIED